MSLCVLYAGNLQRSLYWQLSSRVQKELELLKGQLQSSLLRQ